MLTATLRFVGTIVAVLTLGVPGVGTASAHTALADSSPAADASVAGPPSVIVLTFTEDINPAFANVAVSSTDGRNWASGAPRVEGSRLITPVGPDRLRNGAYTVGYRVVSADGHPVTGSYKFTIVGVPSESAPAPISAGGQPTSTAPPTGAAESSGTRTPVLTAAVAGLALGVGIAVWQSRRRRRRGAVVTDETPPETAERSCGEPR